MAGIVMLAAAWPFVPAVSSASAADAPSPVLGGMNALAEFETVLATRYALSDLKVDWTLGASLARELAGLEGAQAESRHRFPPRAPIASWCACRDLAKDAPSIS